jgi:hypothetical protein
MRIAQLIVPALACAMLALPVAADDLCPPDEVWAIVDGSSVFVHHDFAQFNCCPEMAYEISQDGWLIDIFETELLGVCFCECCFDLTHELRDLAPGTYTVRVWGAYGCQDVPCGEAEFTISQGTGSPVVETAMSGCGGWSGLIFADGFDSGDLSRW